MGALHATISRGNLRLEKAMPSPEVGNLLEVTIIITATPYQPLFNFAKLFYLHSLILS